MPVLKNLMPFLAVGALLFPGTGFSEESILMTLMMNTKAIVSVQAETAAIYGDKPQAFIHKESGQLIIKRSARPVYHSRKGSGVIISPSGDIVANAHTVNQATRITVTLHDGSEFNAAVIGILPEMDLAVLRIEAARELDFVPLSDSDQIKLEAKVYSVGGSALLKNTISEGKLSGIAVHKSNPQNQAGILQVTFDIYEGDSGSPLFDEEGNLLGIMSAAAKSKSKTAFAIPSNAIKAVYQSALQAHSQT